MLRVDISIFMKPVLINFRQQLHLEALILFRINKRLMPTLSCNSEYMLKLTFKQELWLLNVDIRVGKEHQILPTLKTINGIINLRSSDLNKT